MRRLVVVVAIVCGMVAPMASAAYVIDGSLSDWGVTPFSNWTPVGTADFTQTDNVNLYNAMYYEEFFDVEAMYFDNDATNFYMAVVSSYPVSQSGGAGDLGLDFNGDMKISEHGIVTGLEYAIRTGSAGPLGAVIAHPTWNNTLAYQWPDGWQGSPYTNQNFATGTTIGSAIVASQFYPGLEDGTYILEISAPRSLFGGGDVNDLVGVHWTMFCGNDSINLVGDIDPVPPPPPVPVPATLLLAGLGAAFVGGLRRHKMM